MPAGSGWLARFAVIFFMFIVVGCSASQQNSRPETVLVGGVTGRQGTAVVGELLRRGYRVRGLTRKPDSKKALVLAEHGVEIVQGDYADEASLVAALAGIDKMFFYSGFSRNEVAEGKNVIAAARAAGVTHLVYSSGAAAEPGNGIPKAAKMQIEEAIVSSGLTYTVFRPVAFMENLNLQQKLVAKKGITDSRDPERILHFISIPDIGFFVGESFDSPDEWSDVAINIASERMTVAEYVQTIGDVMGRSLPYNQQPLEEYLAGMPKFLRPLFRWYENVGYEADVDSFRQRYPDLTTLDGYLRATGWENWQPN
jgi:uncharacterized protein YbjT (DUF2867 family)